ncbi:hypothetical protein JYQ62_08140 [Nostoc sp. UHCC 0702]|nr:hypothetical protein JYQ62_08140 [Nostoc sp. UHCC 0702]
MELGVWSLELGVWSLEFGVWSLEFGVSYFSLIPRLVSFDYAQLPRSRTTSPSPLPS